MRLLSVTQAAEYILQGGIILAPTDTVWGLLVDATNEFAVNKVADLKGRTREKGFISVVSSYTYLQRIGLIVSEEQHAELQKFPHDSWVFPYSGKCKWLAQSGEIAFRIVTDYPLLFTLGTRLQLPLVATSANASGQEIIQTPEQLPKEMQRKVAGYLPGFPLRGTPSRVRRWIDGEILR